MSVELHTAPASRATVEPFFLETPHGRLFAVHHRPSDARIVRGHVLCVPPFNEEANRCRSMITLQACALRELGIGTLLVDLYGTGDSAGEYGDARWDIWQENIRAGTAWLANQPGGCRAIWGIRLGVMLAAEYLRNDAAAGSALIAWQPVVDGTQYFNQFLRMRIAAQMDRPQMTRETTASMRKQLADGQSIEVAGYEINTQLAAAIDAARLGDVPPPPGTPVLWLEQAAGASTEATLPSQKVISAWRESGLAPDVSLFNGGAFWQIYERTIAPAAIEATTAWARKTWSIE
jgi:exosortase A-associated hydrolase 2